MTEENDNVIKVDFTSPYTDVLMECHECGEIWEDAIPRNVPALHCPDCGAVNSVSEQQLALKAEFMEFEAAAAAGQTKWESFIEAKVDTIIGFIVSMAAWMFVVPLVWPEMAPYTGAGHAIGVTLLFTGLSMARKYLTRRLFNFIHLNRRKP